MTISQEKSNSMRAKEIEMLFAAAMNKVNEYKKDYGITCSDKIVFGGFVDELYSPVSLIYKKSLQSFYVYFSSHYMNNDNEKIFNVLIRYIMTTNTTPSFKNVNEIREEMKKLPFDTHHEVAFRNNYLLSDSPVMNGVICEDCLRIYRCDVDSDLFKNIQNYKCQCRPEGGRLSLIINGKKQMNKERLKEYQKITLADINCLQKDREEMQRIDSKKMSEDDFDPEIFSEEGLEAVNGVIAECKNKITRRPIISAIENNIDNPEILAMLAQAFKQQYLNAYRYSGYDNQVKIVENPIAHPRCEGWDVEVEKQRLINKARTKERQESKPKNVEELIDSLDIKESTRSNLKAALCSNNKKISKMKVAEYVESSLAAKDYDFITVLNDNYPEVFLESIHHVSKASRSIIYERFAPKTDKFDDAFKKKYPCAEAVVKESNIKNDDLNLEKDAKPMDKLMTFIRITKRLGNKELVHELNDAIFNQDSEYVKILYQAFEDKFNKMRTSLPNNVMTYLDKLGL